ncbi:MAG: energy transducer TonB [Sulfuricaulis sp.]
MTTTRYLGQPVLRVQLQENATAHVAFAPKTAPIDALSEKNRTSSVLPATTVQRVSSASPTPDRNPSAGSQQNPKSAIATEAVRQNQLLGELQTDLSRFLVYPPLARRRGWEGTVLLGLRVGADGQFDRIQIEHSSGYPVLDHSALNSLIRLGHLAEASAWLNGQDVNMQLPVIYRLIDN